MFFQHMILHPSYNISQWGIFVKRKNKYFIKYTTTIIKKIATKIFDIVSLGKCVSFSMLELNLAFPPECNVRAQG